MLGFGSGFPQILVRNTTVLWIEVSFTSIRDVILNLVCGGVHVAAGLLSSVPTDTNRSALGDPVQHPTQL